jgi:hypothetical protein
MKTASSTLFGLLVAGATGLAAVGPAAAAQCSTSALKGNWIMALTTPDGPEYCKLTFNNSGELTKGDCYEALRSNTAFTFTGTLDVNSDCSINSELTQKINGNKYKVTFKMTMTSGNMLMTGLAQPNNNKTNFALVTATFQP